jgi:protein-S-isoprenylcysteine O-methyltransferase Ste14
MIVLKSILHNLMVVAIGLSLALVGVGVDHWLVINEFRSLTAAVIGGSFIFVGFLIRVCATYLFYERRMKVIATRPQETLLTSGPYRFSRNPLYLGGNVFIFLGAGLLLGSPAALAITAIHLPFIDLFIRREERQLEQRFGDEWARYRRSVRRWI